MRASTFLLDRLASILMLSSGERAVLFAVALPELDFTNPGDRPKSSLDATKVSWMMTEINYRQVGVDAIKVFCREAGPRDSASHSLASRLS
ncbi:MAG: hypothetical protein WBW76_16780 [Candidatus Cybelea sp.]